MAFFLHVFGIPEEKCWSFGWVLIGRAVTIAILCPEDFYEEQHFFEKNRYLYKWLRSLTGIFIDVWRQCLAGLLKVQITRPDKFWAKTIVITQENCYLFFSDLDADFLRKFWRIFWRCLQKFNLRVHKLFVEIHIFRGKFLFLFLLLAFGQKKDFWKKAAQLYKLYSTCPKKFSGKIFV